MCTTRNLLAIPTCTTTSTNSTCLVHIVVTAAYLHISHKTPTLLNVAYPVNQETVASSVQRSLTSVRVGSSPQVFLRSVCEERRAGNCRSDWSSLVPIVLLGIVLPFSSFVSSSYLHKYIIKHLRSVICFRDTQGTERRWHVDIWYHASVRDLSTCSPTLQYAYSHSVISSAVCSQLLKTMRPPRYP